ncbi:MarR family winged helix-turn-helix transcriptional regulator [Corynebacterium tapiri]|uniref:MarR family transcriptional regulator n=1 Tax=Corynebacterium tapiri TaxID=1448266 RepID=A0A5C4U4R3_9CORY|nr:MarR family transcriptional regulator [Corynebacterium tapiri]TNL98561.1 MarR family transcriptional regulator [Corynebacterium tapiri]
MDKVELSDEWWIELLSATSRFVRSSQAAAGHHPGSATWRVLTTLDYYGPSRATDIARAECSSQPTVSRLLARLRDEDLIATEVDPTDRRAMLVTLTPAGKTLLNRNRQSLVDAVRSVSSSLEQDEIDALNKAVKTLNSLSDSMREHEC